MQLSKREYNKLSAKEQLALSKVKQQNKSKKTQNRKSSPGPRTMQVKTAPVAMSRKVASYAPMEKKKSDGSRVISFKEYVQDIAGSIGFNTTSFPCNPGLSNLFAWLAGQSLFYQEYTVKNLKFRFETEKATTLSGKVMFAFLQDSSDPPPASKQEMLENLLKASGAVWEPFMLPIGMHNFPALGKSRFVRSGNLSPNLDVKTYDIGQLIVATQGMVDTSLVGELYIEYEIELRTPIQSSAQLSTSLSVDIVSSASAVSNFYGTPPTNSPTGAGTSYSGGLNVTAALNTITFNSVGQYLVVIRMTGVMLNTTLVPSTTGSTVGSLVTKAGFSNASANAGTSGFNLFLVAVTARGQTLVLDYTGQGTSISASDTRISPYGLTNN